MNEALFLQRDNVEKKDGEYLVRCPYDGEEFVSKSLETALQMEGVYRSENHIDASENITRKNDMEHTRKYLPDEWSTGENRA